MINRYRIGNPIETDAVITSLPISEGFLSDWSLDKDNASFSYILDDDDMVFGLGETVRGINKRGWLYISNCSDDPNHDEDKHSLYSSMNFFIVFSHKRSLGIYIDTPGKVTFDIGFTKADTMCISLEDFDADVYLITAPTCMETVREFRSITGRSYIPPKWAFGFGQSRWGYKNESDIRDVIAGYQRCDIPLDSVYLDIDYMEDYKDFTIDKNAFPDFEGLVCDAKKQGIHLVPIIDAGVKIEKGYEVYEEGVKNNYFCKKENGEDFVAAVWPGRVHFPDFLNPKVRDWFGQKYTFLTEKGIDGFWNDMNEPAIFYSEEHLNDVFKRIDDFKGKNLNIESYFEFTGMINNISNNPKDYASFYHEYKGARIRHDKVHNLYGFNMSRAASEAFASLPDKKRRLLFSRSSHIGMHRYAGIWTGDNKSWWSHLLLNLQQLPALNMCGFLYCGADTGGFGADCTEDLMLRWLGVSLFTPLFRNHSALGTRDQELYRFEHTDWFRGLIRLRYRLIPYLYSEFMKAALNDSMLFTPLAFEYPKDRRAVTTYDQLLVGQSVMIAPVYMQNSPGRYVYLPEEMMILRFKGDALTEKTVLSQGDHYIYTALDEITIFLRPGRCLPLCDSSRNTDSIDMSTLTYICNGCDKSSYELYDDDGISII